MGPTHVYRATNSERFHARVREDRARPELRASAEESTGPEGCIYYADRGEKTSIDELYGATALPCLLREGDILIMDACLFHFGGANGSTQDRLLLHYSFQAQATAQDEFSNFAQLAPRVSPERTHGHVRTKERKTTILPSPVPCSFFF